MIDIDRLAKCREKKGFSKREAAKRIGVTQPSYVRYEAGDRQPSLHVIQRMALEFGTSVDFLIGKTEVDEPDTFIVKKSENELLFYITTSCADMTQMQLHRVLSYLERLNETSI
ncbi:MAG: helix-turn-helix transcriptional regulator [Lachnospiraceae bacterium]|nr:helix-turn-helix transcriptional regulator [Lachnospiraceae bacterium]